MSISASASIRFLSSPMLTLWALILLSLAAPLSASTRNVPAQYITIQAAVDASVNGDTVLVADGTYSGSGNRDIDFNGKNITVMSVNGPTKTIIDCGGFNSSDGSGNHRGFYLHSGETSAAISGFTVKNGYETSIDGVTNSGYGGGIYLENTGTGTITLTNCTVTGNSAIYHSDSGAGGVYALNDGSGTISVTNCTITGNINQGVYNHNSGSGTISLINCTVTGNSASYGGGVYNYNYAYGTIILINCTITGNSATEGGGVFNLINQGGTLALTNCAIVGNTARVSGSGIYITNYGSSILTLTNCTITNNQASSGAGFLYAYGNGISGTLTLTNCILYGDTNSELDIPSNPSVMVNKCDVQGGYPGTGNINADPKFVNSPSDLHLQYGSPCLGNGTTLGASTTTIDGYTRPNPPSIGAYEVALPITHILWGNVNGALSLWNCSTATGSFTQNTFGPYTGWSAKAIADGSDGKTRVLWDKNDGTMSLWSLDNTTGFFSQHTFGPYTGWTANAISVGVDGTTHVMWDNASGAASVWNYSTTSGSFTSQTYGPFAGWTAKAVADGSDGKTRLMWDNSNGTMSLWNLDNSTGAYSQYSFGPYAGWTAIAESTGP